MNKNIPKQWSMQTNEDILVSIITPSFNQGQFIEETILSVLNQSYKNIEYMIVDGGSTDHTMQVIAKYRDRIKIVIHEKDKGQSDAINKGFKLATGQLVGWINSDDFLYPNCVAEIVDLYRLHTDGAIFYGSKINYIDAVGKVFKTKSIVIPTRDYLLNDNYDTIQQGSFYRLDLVKKVGYCDEQIRYCMDLDLWLRLLELGGVFQVEKTLAAFRFWELSKTTSENGRFLQNIKETLFKYGMKPYSANHLRLKKYIVKTYIKNCLVTLKAKFS